MRNEASLKPPPSTLYLQCIHFRPLLPVLDGTVQKASVRQLSQLSFSLSDFSLLGIIEHAEAWPQAPVQMLLENRRRQFSAGL